ncbi:AI-2E family transporter, partial [Mesorhizobium sp.]|uniref:AI-2E family transporter n=1 Tax=Mesorhizobium sp. TaxID=1871066 RepID=UPI0025DC6A0D
MNRQNGTRPSGSGLVGLLAASRAHPRTALPTVATVVTTVAALYFGREVFLPIAVALLLTFALAPLVSALKRVGIPRLPAVIASVLGAFAALAMFSFVVATQVSDLAQNIPVYQINILTKIRALKETGLGGGIIARLSGVIERVGQEIERQEPQLPSATETPKRDPIPVEIVAHEKPLEVLQNLVAPLLSPLASAGLVIVVVIFMLMEREDLRDRFIRLVGYGDLHRTTQALQDAGKRVGQYLLMQLVVNIVYAVPITIGLWVLGIPNALLWGMLALALRFVPYIGPIIGALLPLFLALAVAPGWALLLWTAALFIVMELITGNVIEPWLYGSRTGLSPLAIIVAAIFWTWLWGPLGLVLSTPLTVCLVVLGRHVPQFEFLDVLFGNEPVLEPHARLYQRLLAGDPDEATDHAEEFLEDKYLFEFYDKVAIPALLLGEHDRMRGVLDDEQRRLLAGSAETLVANLDDSAQQEAEDEPEAAASGDDKAGERKASERKPGEDKEVDEAEEVNLPDGTGIAVLCAGGRGELDDAAAAMLAQVLEVQGAEATKAGFADLEPGGVRRLELDALDAVVIGFLDRDSVKHARFLV